MSNSKKDARFAEPFSGHPLPHIDAGGGELMDELSGCEVHYRIEQRGESEKVRNVCGWLEVKEGEADRFRYMLMPVLAPLSRRESISFTPSENRRRLDFNVTDAGPIMRAK